MVHSVSPCRVVDTRTADPSLSAFSGDRIAPGETVPFYVIGALIDGQGGAADCGVPATATGVFVNVTAVRPQGSGASGFLTLFPYGESLPRASTINYTADTTAVANGVLVPLCDSAVRHLRLRPQRLQLHQPRGAPGDRRHRVSGGVGETGAVLRQRTGDAATVAARWFGCPCRWQHRPLP